MLLYCKGYLLMTCFFFLLFFHKIYTDKQRKTHAHADVYGPGLISEELKIPLWFLEKRPRDHSALTAVTRYCAYIYVIVCAFVTKGCQRTQPCTENLIKTLYSHKGQSTPSCSQHFSWKTAESIVCPLQGEAVQRKRMIRTMITPRLRSIDLHSWTRNNEFKQHNDHGVWRFCNWKRAHITKSFKKKKNTYPNVSSRQYLDQHWCPGLGYIVWFIRFIIVRWQVRLCCKR